MAPLRFNGLVRAECLFRMRGEQARSTWSVVSLENEFSREAEF